MHRSVVQRFGVTQPAVRNSRATTSLFGSSTSGNSFTSRTTSGLSCFKTLGRSMRTYSHPLDAKLRPTQTTTTRGR
jgi:hypothetical protein